MFNQLIKLIASQVDKSNDKEIKSLSLTVKKFKSEINHLQSDVIRLKSDHVVHLNVISSLQRCIATLQEDYYKRLKQIIEK